MSMLSTPWLRAFPDYLLDINRLCSRFGTSQLCLMLLQRMFNRALITWQRDRSVTNLFRLTCIENALHVFKAALSTGIAEQD